jgi:hypothetical protein
MESCSFRGICWKVKLRLCVHGSWNANSNSFSKPFMNKPRNSVTFKKSAGEKMQIGQINTFHLDRASALRLSQISKFFLTLVVKLFPDGIIYGPFHFAMECALNSFSFSEPDFIKWGHSMGLQPKLEDCTRLWQLEGSVATFARRGTDCVLLLMNSK